MGPPRFELGSPAPKASRKGSKKRSNQKNVEGFVLIDGVDLKKVIKEDLGNNYKTLVNGKFSKQTVEKLLRSGKAKGFLKYMQSKGTSINTIRDILSAAFRLLPEDVMTPEDLEEIETTKYLTRFLQNFFTYLDQKKGVDKLNGYKLTMWRKAIPKPDEGVDEVYPTNEDIVEAYILCPENFRPYFQLLVYSGVRLAQILRALETFDENKIVVTENVARYPLGYVSEGKKKGYWIFFPSYFVDRFKQMARGKIYSYEYLRGELIIGKVSTRRIRKWHANFLVENEVDPQTADFIQGRATLTVGSTHYFKMTNIAVRNYSKVVDRFPIPP